VENGIRFLAWYVWSYTRRKITLHREKYPRTLFLNWEHSFLKTVEYILISMFSILERNGEKRKVKLSLFLRTNSLFNSLYSTWFEQVKKCLFYRLSNFRNIFNSDENVRIFSVWEYLSISLLQIWQKMGFLQKKFNKNKFELVIYHIDSNFIKFSFAQPKKIILNSKLKKIWIFFINLICLF